MDDAAVRRHIAQDLIEIGAVTFSPETPFSWASGLLAPVYCDNRLTLGYPLIRGRITNAFVSVFKSNALAPDVLAGTATAGIPHAAWLADLLVLPMVYVRSKPKGHGKGSQIEGPLRAGQSVVVIEDLISTGGSSIAVVDVLRAAGANVLAVAGIFSYELDEARSAFFDAAVPLHTLTDFDHLMEVAKETGALDAGGAATIAAWREDPWAWTRHRRETAESS